MCLCIEVVYVNLYHFWHGKYLNNCKFVDKKVKSWFWWYRMVTRMTCNVTMPYLVGSLWHRIEKDSKNNHICIYSIHKYMPDIEAQPDIELQFQKSHSVPYIRIVLCIVLLAHHIVWGPYLNFNSFVWLLFTDLWPKQQWTFIDKNIQYECSIVKQEITAIQQINFNLKQVIWMMLSIHSYFLVTLAAMR